MLRPLALSALFLAALAVANLSLAFFGPKALLWNALVFVGLDLTARDSLHDALGRWRLPALAALIAAGGALSWALTLALELSPPFASPERVAAASACSFAAAALLDALLYARLRERPWLERANGSNAPAAALDSALFPLAAFGSLSAESFLAAASAKVAGGLLWSFALRRRRS